MARSITRLEKAVVIFATTMKRNAGGNDDNDDNDLYQSRRYEYLQLALDLMLKKARDSIDMERAITLGYTAESSNAAVYQKVLHGVLDSVHSEIKKRMGTSFEELGLEDKLLRFELAVRKEQQDREGKEREFEKERQDAKNAIESVRKQTGIDPEALIRHRQCQELRKKIQALENITEAKQATVEALQSENAERAKAIEQRLDTLNVKAEGVSQAADLCASTGL